MSQFQSGILDEVPLAGRYLYFRISDRDGVRDALQRLGPMADGQSLVVGIGSSLVKALDCHAVSVPDFPAGSYAGVDIPSTPTALWCWLRGDDQGDLHRRSNDVMGALAGGFALYTQVQAFRYAEGRDLTGYEDGTENPSGEDAVAAAFIDQPGHLQGSSFVAVQKWVHDLHSFSAMSQTEQDNTIGRRLSDNEELDDAPDSAHVKRTAQESFEPEAFLLRRSMPWAESCIQGLMFVAFANRVDPFEAQLHRMVGAEDGVLDALFTFSHPVSGNYFWCPPVDGGRVDFSALGV